ncbi:uncharacterized protein METZ01_LOCUS149535, partial [marine metagenome]
VFEGIVVVIWGDFIIEKTDGSGQVRA